MTASYLTTSESSLVSGIIAAFVGDGYAFNPLLTSVDEYLVGVLNGLTGSSFSHLTMSRDEVLARIANDLTESSSYSHLLITQDELLALVLANHEGGGGGDETPEWVLAGAKIDIDFLNDRAWVDGTGLVEIATLVGEDSALGVAWGATEYDPDGLTADGYNYLETENHVPEMALIGDARTEVLAGATIRLSCKDIPEYGAYNAYMVLVSADGNAYIQVQDDTNSRAVLISSEGALGGSTSSTISNRSTSNAINVMVITATDTRIEVAQNGALLLDLEADEDDAPPGNPFVGVVVRSTRAFQRITIYDALPSTTGLAALSETGVTNTAPSEIIVIWNGETGPETGTFLEGDMTGPVAVSNELQALDAEGNPVVFSLVDDAGGTFELVEGQSVVTTEALSAGEYDFTLRATDPGGLYVEQEFTITVTA